MVRATVFRDLNDNGVRDPGEPPEKGALITTGARQVERKTDAKGSVTVGGLTPYMSVPVGLDATSLGDPMLVPKKAIQVVVPRPGVPAEVEIALSVGDALQKLEQGRFDVLISDIGMPGRDGYELIRELRGRAPEAGGAIFAIALTAYARDEDRRRALAEGFHDHTPKPVDAAELIRSVAAVRRQV
jgi:CheY-like chemotaxis protein